MDHASPQDNLKRYRDKRDFSRTPEPSGGRRKKRGKPAFVVQKHAARRLHYDVRLEHDGVLKSWAVTKGPSLDPADKRLAVRTEDHPLDYGTFEGTIPEGEYGGGTVMLWDRGSWEPQGDVEQGFKEGKLKFRLNGERLKGGWALVRMKADRRSRSKRENWLLIKERDSEARENGDALLKKAGTSVASGRKMAEIAKGDDVWSSKTKRNPGKAAAKGAAKLPAFIAPQLATLVDEAPRGSDWLHEIKYDGYRALASIAGGKVRIRTRNGHDWTEKFKPLVAPLSKLDCDSALIDGEIAVADAKGRTDFGALQNALSNGGGKGIGYYVFDLLSLNGEDLRKKPLSERKETLKKLLSGLPRKGPVAYSDHVAGQGGTFYAHACDLDLEGIVSKRADAPYRSGRTRSWLKVKCGMGQEFVIIGWRPSDKKGRPFSSLLLAVNRNGELAYAGRVGSGFSDEDFDTLAPKLKDRARKTPPVAELPAGIARDAKFVTPDLVAEIAFRGWTRDGLVRQGSFKGLRADKPASRIVKETAMPKQGFRASENGAIEIEGVRVTNPDRVLFPGQGLTKRDLIDHYLSVVDRILPHVRNRPLSLVRCPKGRSKKCFYQKHASDGFPAAFREIEIAEKSGRDHYLYIEDKAGLVAAVQMGVLELHVWGARTDRIERPDRLVFDLDPDEEIPFERVKEGAREMRQRLDELGLSSFLLATGGKGLHVVVPFERRHDWDAHKDFAEAMARAMARDAPERYTATLSKSARRGRVFIDYLRNGRGATAIAPFSSRAREGGPVAFPLPWSALSRLENANSVTVGEAAARLTRYKSDPWEGYFEVRQRLPKLGR